MAAQTLAGAQDALELEQAYCQHKFHYYRNGLDGYHVSLQEIHAGAVAGNAHAIARWADIQNRWLHHLPRVGAIYGFTQAHSARLNAVAVPIRQPFQTWRGRPPALRRPGAKDQAEVKKNLNNFRNLLRSTFSYIKCLGWGGEGVVSLWRYRPSRGAEHRVVMKASVRRGRSPASATQDLIAERSMMTVSTIEYDTF